MVKRNFKQIDLLRKRRGSNDLADPHFIDTNKLTYIDPKFRSKKVIIDNIKKFKPEIKEDEINHIIEKMWGNYGRILAEYVYIPEFRKRRLDNYIKIEGLENLKKIKNSGKPTVFITGHFNIFELMAMVIEREGVDLSAVYRPLNNKFLNILRNT